SCCCGCRSIFICGRCCDADGINSAALHEIKIAAVASPLHIAVATAESAACAAASATTAGISLRDDCETRAVITNCVKSGAAASTCATSVASALRNERDGAAIGR